MLQRLGRADLPVTYSSKEEMETDIFINNLMKNIADHDLKGLEGALAEIDETAYVADPLHKQYIDFAKAVLSAFKGTDAEQVLPELVRTLGITKKDFELGKRLPGGLYTYNEIVIVNAIAVLSFRTERICRFPAIGYQKLHGRKDSV